MTETQTLRQVAQARTPFSTWLGVVLLFVVFGIIAWALIGPERRTSDYEQKRAANREAKLAALREQDAQALTGYAWVDKAKGTVRIPIDRAMELALAELGRKKPAAAGPIATPAPEAPAAGAGVATPPAAATPAGSPAPSTTPKGVNVEGHGAKAQPAAATNPPGAAPGTQPGASASPAASSAPAAIPPSSPQPIATPSAAAPLPVRGKTPGDQ
jgi:hypothetical protein